MVVGRIQLHAVVDLESWVLEGCQLGATELLESLQPLVGWPLCGEPTVHRAVQRGSCLPPGQ